MAVLANILWPFAVVTYGASAVAAGTGRMRHCLLLAALGTGLILAECVLERDWLAATFQAVLVIILLGWDWWNRNGKRVAKALGEKSRAALAAIVEKAREAGSPVPERVRA
jgi:cobalamin biosynthesis protein CobD/CbiB